MHGCTGEMVDYFVSALADKGVRVEPYDLTVPDIGKLAIDLAHWLPIYLDAGELTIIDVSGLDIAISFYFIQHRGRALFSCSRMFMDSVEKYIKTV